jgi:threonine dehydratase
VITASAGNHAQGVALAAERLGAPATIVMPTTTPHIKVDAVAARGAAVVLQGDSYDDANAHALGLAQGRELAFVHPYDDPDVIAGQGTIAVEILRQCQEPIHAIFVPVGGGGLVGGIAAYVKRLRPETRIVGVEPEDADAMHRSLRAGRRVTLSHVGLFADGVAVRQVGSETFRLARKFVDEIVLVDTDELCAAIKDVFEDTRSIAEPAGALGVAGAKRYAEREGIEGQILVAVLSGANTNFDRLRFVAERAELGEQREAVFAATIPERPGSFRTFCELIGKRNITEFNYRYDDPAEAHVFVGVEVRNLAEKGELLATLEAHGIRTLDLSDNETAKLHVRHLVGGRADQARHELLYRFEFPERPGALMKFLNSMGGSWNISLFHYRNHGADHGRVLAGIQVPPVEMKEFRRFLESLGYEYWDETRNPAYELFLS